MDPASHYPEPLEEAFGHGAQRAAQLAAIVTAAAQVYAQYRAHRQRQQAARDEQTARTLREQERAANRQARMGWAPAHDARWLAQAGLLDTANVWGAAAPYADADPVAASALRTCEDRLRALHPYAMARYDRLRADGMNPIEAMREAVPLFTDPDFRAAYHGRDHGKRVLMICRCYFPQLSEFEDPVDQWHSLVGDLGGPGGFALLFALRVRTPGIGFPGGLVPDRASLFESSWPVAE